MIPDTGWGVCICSCPTKIPLNYRKHIFIIFKDRPCNQSFQYENFSNNVPSFVFIQHTCIPFKCLYCSKHASKFFFCIYHTIIALNTHYSWHVPFLFFYYPVIISSYEFISLYKKFIHCKLNLINALYKSR